MDEENTNESVENTEVNSQTAPNVFDMSPEELEKFGAQFQNSSATENSAENTSSDNSQDKSSASTLDNQQPKEQVQSSSSEQGEPNQVKGKSEVHSYSGSGNKAPAQLSTQNDIDQKLQWFKLTEPFNVGKGKMFAPESVEEAKNLIRKGLDYTRKTQELAKERELAGIIRANQLQDPAKLGFMLDLYAGKKEAIQKLLHQHKIDPSDLMSSDFDDKGNPIAPNYTPSAPAREDAQRKQVLDTLNEIKAQPGGQATIDMVMQEWDDDANEYFYAHPGDLQKLANMRNFVFPNGETMHDRIMNRLEHMRLSGKIPEGTPDLKAYYLAGDSLRQEWNAQENNPSGSNSQSQKSGQVRNLRKQAAKPAKTESSGSSRSAPNIFAMNEQEMEAYRKEQGWE